MSFSTLLLINKINQQINLVNHAAIAKHSLGIVAHAPPRAVGLLSTLLPTTLPYRC